MPIYEYECGVCGKKFTKMFLTFASAEMYENSYPCEGCLRIAQRVMSVPAPGHFYGSPDGYAKPSPAKRHSYKIADKKKGNSESMG